MSEEFYCRSPLRILLILITSLRGQQQRPVTTPTAAQLQAAQSMRGQVTAHPTQPQSQPQQQHTQQPQQQQTMSVMQMPPQQQMV